MDERMRLIIGIKVPRDEFGKDPRESMKQTISETREHYLIGGNPNDLEHGFWDTEQDAIINFALQFAKLAENAQGNFLFVRKAPELVQANQFEGGTKWRMIGRFSIAKLKEKNGGR